MHRGRTTSTWLAVAALGLVLSACGGGSEPSVERAEFSAAMVDRFGATAAQAECITGYVFDAYDDAEIQVLVDEGMPALPQARWSAYLNASAACITHDQPLEGGG